MTTLIHAENTSTDRVTLELRTFIAHCDPESRGVSCVVVNGTRQTIRVSNGYDGKSNQLISRNAPYPIGLHPPSAPGMRVVKVEPGMRETIFSLSLDEIFFLEPGAERAGWNWRWVEPAPRGAPPMSPFHGHKDLGWEVRRADRATIVAAVEVDDQRIESEPLEINAKKLSIEVVRARVRFQTARVIESPHQRRYEITFDVHEAIEGVVGVDERTLTLDAQFAEPLMKEARVRWNLATGRFLFAAPPMTLTFARISEAGGRAGGLVLMSCEATHREDALGRLNFAAPDGSVLIAATDLLAYEWPAHTIRLRSGVLGLLRDRLQAELARGAPFVLRLGDTPLYTGVFTTGLSSIAQSLPVVLLDGDDAVTIQLGYPTREQFQGDDPRSDRRIEAALRKSGKLHE